VVGFDRFAGIVRVRSTSNRASSRAVLYRSISSVMNSAMYGLKFVHDRYSAPGFKSGGDLGFLLIRIQRNQPRPSFSC